MWNIGNLKRRAKIVLKRSYWPALLVSFILAIVGASNSGGIKVNLNMNLGNGMHSSVVDEFKDLQTLLEDENLDYSDFEDEKDFDEKDFDEKDFDEEDFYEKDFYEKDFDDEEFDIDDYLEKNNKFNFNNFLSQMSLDDDDENVLKAFTVIFITIFIIVFILVLAFKIFVSNPLEVGGRYFFIQNIRKNKNDLNDLGYAFKKNKYLKVVKTLFKRDLYLFGWSLIGVIPAMIMTILMTFSIATRNIPLIIVSILMIFVSMLPVTIKQYSYSQVPYIVADNPDISSNRAIELSRQMMDGHKMHSFLLNLSFVGWYILGAIAFGIGIIFVHPYANATKAELYEELRKIAINQHPDSTKRIADENELGLEKEEIEEPIEFESKNELVIESEDLTSISKITLDKTLDESKLKSEIDLEKEDKDLELRLEKLDLEVKELDKNKNKEK